MQSSSVSSSPSTPHGKHNRSTLLIIIVVAALIAIGWIAYQNFNASKQPHVLTEQEKAAILGSVESNSAPVPDATQTQILKNLEQQNANASANINTKTASGPSASGPSAADQAAILKNLGAQ